jgi:hypothetical protein
MADQLLTQDSRGGGCFKGCLITVLILFLLAVVLIIGGYFAGQSYFEAKLVEWKAEYPILSVVSDLMSLDRNDPFKLLRETERTRVEGTNDWDSLPAYLPVFDDAIAQTASISDSSVTVYQEVPGRVARVFRTALSRFQAAGWKCSEVGEAGAVCRKEEGVCSMKVTQPIPFLLSGVESAEVWLTCSREKEAGDE